MTEMPDEIRPLVGIRGLATAWVVGYHMFPILYLLAPSTGTRVNYLASSLIMVDFFFMLSGFIITFRYLDSFAELSGRNTMRYLSLRFARIWPVHAVMLLAFLLYGAWSEWALGYGLEADNTSVGNVLANLAMLHEIPPATTINPPSWSLAPEFAAYLAFPLLALLLVKVRTAEVAGAAAIVILAGGTALLWWLYEVNGSDGSAYALAWPRIAVCFPVGCLIAIGWRKLSRWQREDTDWDSVALFGFAATAFVVWVFNRAGEFEPPVLAFPFLALVVLGCAGSTGIVATVLGHPVLEWCGRVSYSVYLTHFLVIIAVYGVLVRHGAQGTPQIVRLLILIGVMALIVAAGALSYYAVEEPSRKALRRLTHRRWGRVAGAGGKPTGR